MTGTPTFAPPPGFERLRLLLAWDGADFAGWQAQRNAPSVQETLHAALVRLGGAQVARPVAAGRTDTGVHAEAMPAHVDVPEGFRVPPDQLARALNAHLPPSVAVLEARPAPAGFHARFSCTGRRYTYRLLNTPQRHPLWAGRALHVPGPLDVPAMNAAATLLVGTHDFAAFATREDRQTVREVREIAVHPGPTVPGGSVWEVRVAGESFLRHMVRGLVGTLLLVGQGKLGPEEVAEVLAGRERARAGANVPGYGLTFTGASYGERFSPAPPPAGAR
ncbi:tRNA pseudouridine(38-40) synthase TruA [Deinococcus metallilatus]|uniref:tRNA pseudouridine synthase A n=1 Tax=Deinococcus metallilatus TaxID=1211322 RepID=A0AAJ5F4P5_9DEIO|nr:tRNA pseudouridine(38-40) synthase TruA [Deinococcus metallilatus]MBB5294576.1 tRNA pseudouridine38-40 synthase [Deinococcus metallilatus]QBY07619.1 tRNA pseudouridine(38-40) synthase TruA [Deinococcus metallilatus]RXJ14035.1 tRNA pseudouridine(38-40) synthase TruA [Deinococcus metallilatus]TLK30000.1 tRNA pseudouridine(38-40) synthase TruA [Deinococcus metallilatus]GMA15789.1 tRNA pseudouridine synthase A [Deinococcus metallilatus]